MDQKLLIVHGYCPSMKGVLGVHGSKDFGDHQTFHVAPSGHLFSPYLDSFQTQVCFLVLFLIF